MRRAILIPAAAVVIAAVLGGWLLVSSVHSPRSLPAPSTPPSRTSTASPLPALPPLALTGDTDYVALGDSYAAGMGGGDETGSCLRSQNGYPDVFAKLTGLRHVDNAACSGATTTDLLANQLSALSDSTALVTVSIGGNDLDVAGLAAACAEQDSTACESSFAASVKSLTVLGGRLESTYSAVAASAPNARIVVTGYVQLFTPPPRTAPDFTSIAATDTATAALNSVIKSAVLSERKRGVTISFAGVSFAGHSIGSADSWLHASGPTAYHPTTAGYRQYARAVEKSVKTRT